MSDNPILKMNLSEFTELYKPGHRMLAMRNHAIYTVGDLINYTEKELLALKHSGPKWVKKLKDFLRRHKLSLRYDSVIDSSPPIMYNPIKEYVLMTINYTKNDIDYMIQGFDDGKIYSKEVLQMLSSRLSLLLVTMHNQKENNHLD